MRRSRSSCGGESPKAQVDEILKKGQADFKFTILSPVSGHVFRKSVVEGQEVQEGYPMFEVVDLQSVWVQAQVYEHELALVHEGQTVEATVEAFPGETFAGTVDLIQPRLDTVDPDGRSAVHAGQPFPSAAARHVCHGDAQDAGRRSAAVPKQTSGGDGSKRQRAFVGERRAAEETAPSRSPRWARWEPPVEVRLLGRKVWTCCSSCPPKLKAQPQRYLARFEPAPRDQVLSVPEAAVIDTGTRKVVYVEVEPGVYDGREVVLGNRIRGRFPVLEGLAPGERVAAAGAFLIDAESRLNPTPPAEAEPQVESGDTSAHDGQA